MGTWVLFSIFFVRVSVKPESFFFFFLCVTFATYVVPHVQSLTCLEVSQFIDVSLVLHSYYCPSPGVADPYLNTDAGTMSPFEHGEVFVLDDGGEVWLL